MRKTLIGNHHKDQTTLIPCWKRGDQVELMRGGAPTGIFATVDKPDVAGNPLGCWVRIDSDTLAEGRMFGRLAVVAATDMRRRSV